MKYLVLVFALSAMMTAQAQVVTKPKAKPSAAKKNESRHQLIQKIVAGCRKNQALKKNGKEINAICNCLGRGFEERLGDEALKVMMYQYTGDPRLKQAMADAKNSAVFEFDQVLAADCIENPKL